MKCMECKILRFDGQKYSCPAHPYHEDFDFYTEHSNCRAPKWYPEYILGHIEVLTQNIHQLDRVLPDLANLIRSWQEITGYGKMMRDQLELIYKDFFNRRETMKTLLAEAQTEYDRITRKELR